MEKIIIENQQWIDEIWNRIDKKLKHVSVSAFDKLPYTTQNGVYINDERGYACR